MNQICRLFVCHAIAVFMRNMVSVGTNGGGILIPTPRGRGNGRGVKRTKKAKSNGVLPQVVQREVIRLAKDGTARGGQRTGSGRKSKALADKVSAGNPGGRQLKVIDLPNAPDLVGADMPDPRDYLKDKQKIGEDFLADELYRETWLWLKERGCERLISKQTIEQYAIAAARAIQCERAVSEFGFLAKHPTTQAPIASPYVAMAQQYQKQSSAIWYSIFQVVKENCSTDYKGASPADDMMERLLRTGRSN